MLYFARTLEIRTRKKLPCLWTRVTSLWLESVNLNTKWMTPKGLKIDSRQNPLNADIEVKVMFLGILQGYPTARLRTTLQLPCSPPTLTPPSSPARTRTTTTMMPQAPLAPPMSPSKTATAALCEDAAKKLHWNCRL